MRSWLKPRLCKSGIAFAGLVSKLLFLAKRYHQFIYNDPELKWGAQANKTTNLLRASTTKIIQEYGNYECKQNDQTPAETLNRLIKTEIKMNRKPDR